MAGEKYRVQVTALLDNLNSENRLYFDRLYDTLLLNGAIYNSAVVSELAYDVLLDLLEHKLTALVLNRSLVLVLSRCPKNY